MKLIKILIITLSSIMTEQQTITADAQIPQFIDHPLLESIVTLHIEGKWGEIENVIKSATQQERENMVTNLNMCQCCDEHKKRKPNTYKPLPYYSPSSQEIKSCKCMCRHICRDICRQHPNYTYDVAQQHINQDENELQRSLEWISSPSDEEREEDWDW